jgi:hypothetical protein
MARSLNADGEFNNEAMGDNHPEVMSVPEYQPGYQNRVQTQERLSQPILTKARILRDNC